MDSAALTFLLFVAATLLITRWAAGRTRTRSDFYTADSRVTGVQNGFAIAGDSMSAASFLGLIGLTFVAGYDVFYFIISLGLGLSVLLLLIAERLRNLGQFTFADVVSVRLQPRPVRTFAAVATFAVSIPYLIAQMVAAGTLVEQLFGLSYFQGVLVVGVLMTIYVTFGGMIATTWVQIVKAVLLLAGGAMLLFLVMIRFRFDPVALMQSAVDVHPLGTGLLQPGGLYTDIISILSLSLAFIGGMASLPHVLMRFFTVPDGRQARRSAVLALVLICAFQCMVFFIGLGAVVLLAGHPEYTQGGIALSGGSNMAGIHLARELGGEVFLGFISAVAFATILAVVSGLTLSTAASLAHDLFASVLRDGQCSEQEELLVSRAAVVALGVVGVLLALLFEGQNVAVLATLPLVIAASANFPVLLLSMYWPGFTTRGAMAGGYAGLVVSVILVILGPAVWVPALGFQEPVFPYAYPTLFSMPLAFFCAWWFSVTDRSLQAEYERKVFGAQWRQSVTGRGLRPLTARGRQHGGAT